METEKIIYRLNDDISFRKCTLFSGDRTAHGDCTQFDTTERNWTNYFSCKQYGIHLHCTRHPEIELDFKRYYGDAILSCPKCQKEIEIGNIEDVLMKCLKMLNIEKFKGAKLIRLDDWYVPEVKEKIKIGTEYWITSDVKTDKDGDTIVVLYVGHSGSKEKAQFFVKPEKMQLSSDHKDMDPAKILSKIEVTLRNRTLKQEYDKL